MIGQIPDCGCIKEGPLFTYTLWKSLMDYWFRMGAVVTIVTPQIDAERLADILLLMLKNRGAGFMARLYIQVGADNFKLTTRDGKVNFKPMITNCNQPLYTLYGERSGGNSNRQPTLCRENIYIDLLYTDTYLHSTHFICHCHCI